MTITRAVQIATLVVGLIFFAGFAHAQFGTDVPTYRYRIEIALSAKNKPFKRSGVVEVRSGIDSRLLRAGDLYFIPFSRRFYTDFDFEAIPLDLPGRPNLFAIPGGGVFCDPGISEYAEMDDESWKKFHDFRQALWTDLEESPVLFTWGGPDELRPDRIEKRCKRSGDPGVAFVQLDDTARPKHIREFTLQELAVFLAPDYSLESIAIKITDQPPTRRIAKAAPWLRDFPDGLICNDSHPGVERITNRDCVRPFDFREYPFESD